VDFRGDGPGLERDSDKFLTKYLSEIDLKVVKNEICETIALQAEIRLVVH